jgi:peptidoglycan/xylan/chitin deacetylase (PgdA/CDA1 family)
MPWKSGYTISDEIGMQDADVRWPEGKRCAFVVNVDLSVASGPEGITASDLRTPAAELGVGEGLDLVLAALERHGWKATFIVPAVMAAILPGRLRALAAAGHEIASGGLRHEDPSALAREEERVRIAVATQIIVEAVGQRPAGWFCLPRQKDPFAGGTISANTVELLLEAGYGYLGNGLADDIPHYWVSEFAGPRAILAMPYYYHFDDQFFAMFPVRGSGLESIDMLARNWRAELEAQYKRGRYFHLTVHPRLIGWCNRMAAFEAFLAHAASMPGLWNATAGTCARYWLATYPAERTLKLEPSIWQDYPGSLS